MPLRNPLMQVVPVLVALGALGGGVAVQDTATGAPPKHIETRPAQSAQPTSRAEGDETLQAAVAAVVIGALTEQFGDRTIAVKLDSTDVQVASIRDRVISGTGRMQIGADDGEWLGFRYRTLYDTLYGSAGFPELTLGGTDGEREVPNDSGLVSELDAQVAARLDEEFGGQPVRLQLDRIATHEAGKRFLRIEAAGIADFGREGTTAAQVDALYDRRDGSWLRVNYELGPSAGVGSSAGEVAALP